MVTIRGYGEATCTWCQKAKEGVEVETQDRSFTGFFCFNDLKRMLRLKCQAGGAHGRPVEPRAT